METGTVANAIFPGTIQPDSGGNIVQYGNLVVVGPTPGQNDRVKFTRDGNDPGWAASVQLLGAALLSVTAAPAPVAELNPDDATAARRRVSLPGFSADSQLSLVRDTIRQAGAAGFVVHQAQSYYVVPSSAIATIDAPAFARIADVARAHGQILHVTDPAAPGPNTDQFGAEVELATRSKAWAQMVETATAVRCTLNHLHVYSADEGYETCPRDGAPLEPVEV